MMTPTDIKRMIEQGLPGAQAQVFGDDGQHFEAVVSYAAFSGKSLLQQHQMVYATLGDGMESAIHALSIKTKMPGESQGENPSS